MVYQLQTTACSHLAVSHRAGREEVVHSQRAGDEASLGGPGRAAAEHGDSDDPPDAVPVERLGGGPGEAGKGGVDRRRPRVRRRQPENGVGAGKCLVRNRRVAMRALDNVEVPADLGRELCRIAGDDPKLFAALQQVAEHLAADLARGGGDDDHENLRCR